MKIRRGNLIYELVEPGIWIGPCTNCGATHEVRLKDNTWVERVPTLCPECVPGKRSRRNATVDMAYRFMRDIIGRHPWRMKLSEIKARGCPGSGPTVAKALDRLVAEKRVAYRAGYVRTLSPEETGLLIHRRASRAQSAEDALECLMRNVMPHSTGSPWIDDTDAVEALVARGIEQSVASMGVNLGLKRGVLRRGAIRRRIARTELVAASIPPQADCAVAWRP